MVVLRSRSTLKRVLDMLTTWEDDMNVLRDTLGHSRIELPTLLIWGDADPVVPISSAAGLEEHLSCCEMATLPGKGHLLAEEAPARCAHLITTWLSSKP
ncbi:MAG: alpha/beta hydrolase, partial [Bryocella sp.]